MKLQANGAADQAYDAGLKVERMLRERRKKLSANTVRLIRSTLRRGAKSPIWSPALRLDKV